MRQFPLVCAAFIAASAIVSAAHAAIVEVTSSGTITNSNMPAFPNGQSFAVTVRYDSTNVTQFNSGGQGFHVNPMTYIRITSGTYDSTFNTGTFGQINQLDNFSNLDGLSFQVAANAATYQFTNPKPNTVTLATANSQTFDNLIMHLHSTNTSLWSGFNLPTTLNYSDFDSNRTIIMAFSGGSVQVGLQSVAVTPAPEPASLSLVAIGALGLLRRKR